MKNKKVKTSASKKGFEKYVQLKIIKKQIVIACM